MIPGPKWTGLRILLNDWDGWRDYDHIWLPDDDIQVSQDAISAMFQAAAALELELFTPALHESSHFGHYIIMLNRNFFRVARELRRDRPGLQSSGAGAAA